LSKKIGQLKMKAADGKFYATDVADYCRAKAAVKGKIVLVAGGGKG
jgi:hypothetical protein